MKEAPEVVVLCGGISEEREVSLRSGAAVASALEGNRCSVTNVTLDTPALPEEIRGTKQIVFPVLHGAFGEDGTLQFMLEEEGIEYAGSDAQASALCMDKPRAKQVVADSGVSVLPQWIVQQDDLPDAAEVVADLGEYLLVKPANGGSSIGVECLQGQAALEAKWKSLGREKWLIEPLFRGRELSIGMLGGTPLSIVEIQTGEALYDYKHKYEKGGTEYLVPAPLKDAIREKIIECAQSAYGACQCRDFARIDFLYNEDRDTTIFLEINTIPGLTENSLMPKSAAASGLTYEQLCLHMIQPALLRFEADQNLQE